ncbi:MAG: hypothetical protein DRI37_04535 [Chloroflexi bacterium]|nr:MAG: hypothetical protein DRI37_04535 [Chloroflexota bacterium]
MNAKKKASGQGLPKSKKTISKITTKKNLMQNRKSLFKSSLSKYLILPEQLENHYQELLKSSWRIGGILPDDARLTVIYGQPKSYKSFVALDMALSVATGSDYHNRNTNSCNVLYIAAEGQKGILKRVKAWMQERKITKLDNFYPFIKPIAINDKAACNELIDLLRHFSEVPGLIFIDTLNRSLQGNENGDDMTAFVAGVTEISIETGAQVVVIHHTPKTGEGMRGHSSLHGAVDYSWKVEKHKKIPNIAVMSCDNAKDHDDKTTLFFNMKLHQITNIKGFIDLDADGEEITSLVPTLNTELMPEAKKVNAISGWKLKILDALTKNIESSLEEASTLEDWRNCFYSLHGKGINQRSNFSKRSKELIREGYVNESGGYCFLAEDKT